MVRKITAAHHPFPVVDEDLNAGVVTQDLQPACSPYPVTIGPLTRYQAATGKPQFILLPRQDQRIGEIEFYIAQALQLKLQPLRGDRRRVIGAA